MITLRQILFAGIFLGIVVGLCYGQTEALPLRIKHDVKARDTYIAGVIVHLSEATNVPKNIASIDVGIHTFVPDGIRKRQHATRLGSVQLGVLFIGYAERPASIFNHTVTMYALIDGKSYPIAITTESFDTKRVRGNVLSQTQDAIHGTVDLRLLARLAYGQRVEIRINDIELEILPEYRQVWKKLYHTLTS